MKNTFSVLFFLCVTSLFSQEEIEISNLGPSTPKSYITFSALAPIALETPRYRFGYTLPIGEKWMAGLDAGYGSESIVVTIIDRIRSEDYQLYEFRAEVYYRIDAKRKNAHYLSMELGYLNHQETFLDNFFKREIEDTFQYYKRVNFQRKRAALTLKYGAFYDLWDQFGIHIYYGIGIRQRAIQYSNLVDRNDGQNNDIPSADEDSFDEYGFVNRYYREEGTFLGFNFQLGFKLYYSFE